MIKQILKYQNIKVLKKKEFVKDKKSIDQNIKKKTFKL